MQQTHSRLLAIRSDFFRRKVDGIEPSEPFLRRTASYLPHLVVIVAALILTGFQTPIGL